MNNSKNKEIRDIKLLAAFTELYCRLKHKNCVKVEQNVFDSAVDDKKGEILLCSECSDFLSYAFMKRAKCPLDPKPACKHCRIHCYSKSYREKAREIMSYSGKQMILRGRVDYLWHYFF